jgi:CelD/BcsL family acetyltransferase involved in cellulose biosynthesis
VSGALTAPAQAEDLRIEVVSSAADFDLLENCWDDLCNRAIESYPMLLHAWLRAWRQAFAATAECHVVLVWAGKVLVGAAPFTLVVERRFLRTRRVLTLFVNSWVDRTHLLVAAEHDALAIVAAIFGGLEQSGVDFDLVELGPLDDASPLTATLLVAMRERRWRVGVKDSLQSPCLKLPQDWEPLLASLSSGFRQSLRRKLRKVEAIPGASMRVSRDASCLDAISAISLETWQEDQHTSMCSTPAIRDFYATVIIDAAERGSLRCAVLELDGMPVAFDFNLMHRHTLHNFKLGYCKSCAHLSPGVALRAFLLRELYRGPDAAKPVEFDLMGASEPYKLEWTHAIRSHGCYLLFPRRLEPMVIWWAYFWLVPHIRQHAPWLLPPLRTLRSLVRKGGHAHADRK